MLIWILEGSYTTWKVAEHLRSEVLTGTLLEVVLLLAYTSLLFWYSPGVL